MDTNVESNHCLILASASQYFIIWAVNAAQQQRNPAKMAASSVRLSLITPWPWRNTRPSPSYYHHYYHNDNNNTTWRFSKRYLVSSPSSTSAAPSAPHPEIPTDLASSSPPPPPPPPSSSSSYPLKWEAFRKKKVVMRVGYVGTNYRGHSSTSSPFFSIYSFLYFFPSISSFSAFRFTEATGGKHSQ